mmetsp:Transcript_2556/g.7554  ORF Transcript_2556/g.7554 Transcript_2556/m.7554 type:complete len:259 (-) Transcript_2556:341-1117(-)
MYGSSACVICPRVRQWLRSLRCVSKNDVRSSSSAQRTYATLRVPASMRWLTERPGYASAKRLTSARPRPTRSMPTSAPSGTHMTRRCATQSTARTPLSPRTSVARPPKPSESRSSAVYPRPTPEKLSGSGSEGPQGLQMMRSQARRPSRCTSSPESASDDSLGQSCRGYACSPERPARSFMTMPLPLVKSSVYRGRSGSMSCSSTSLNVMLPPASGLAARRLGLDPGSPPQALQRRSQSVGLWLYTTRSLPSRESPMS